MEGWLRSGLTVVKNGKGPNRRGVCDHKPRYLKDTNSRRKKRCNIRKKLDENFGGLYIQSEFNKLFKTV